jgi:hypothetical protein
MKNYAAASDRKDEQERKFWFDFIKPIQMLFRDEASGSFEAILLNSVQIDLTFAEIFTQDFLWVGLSILLVFMYLVFHLKSLFLGWMSMINICMSFPLTVCVYKLIFQVQYYGFM